MWLTGRLPWHKTDRKWEYILAAAAREETGLQIMEEYIRRQQNTVAHYIATRSMLDLCEGLERAMGPGWGCGDGSRQVSIWRGQGKRRRKRKGEKSDGGE